MTIDPVLAHYLHSYLAIGLAFALVSDICIYYLKSSEQYTFLQITMYILFWPIILAVVILSFINKN